MGIVWFILSLFSIFFVTYSQPISIDYMSYGSYRNPSENLLKNSYPICETKESAIIISPSSFQLHQTSSQISFTYGKAIGTQAICKEELSEERVAELINQIDNDYFLSFTIGNEFSAGHFVGAYIDSIPYVYGKRIFNLQYSNGKLAGVTITLDEPQEVVPGNIIYYTYESFWNPVKEKAVLLSPSEKHNLELGFYSIVNSFLITIICLAGIATVWAKSMVSKGYVKPSIDLEQSDGEFIKSIDAVWQQSQGDVFRRPSRIGVFSWIISFGAHAGAFFTSYQIINTMLPKFYKVDTILLYCITHMVNGFVGGMVHKVYAGKKWRRAMWTRLLVPPIFALFYILMDINNYGYEAYIPLIQKFFLILVCGNLPIHIIGTIWGRNVASMSTFPCRTHTIRRPIPAKQKILTPLIQLISGFVIFSIAAPTIQILLHKFWTPSSLLLEETFNTFTLYFTCIFYSICVCCVSIIVTFTLLNLEDHRWAWSSLTTGCLPAVYLALQCLVYFQKSKMTGISQANHYLLTSALFVFLAGSYGSTISYAASSRFVWLLYGNIKFE